MINLTNISLKSLPNHQKQYMQHHSSHFDILLVINGQILPFPSHIITKCQFFKNIINLKQKVYFFDTHFDIICLRKVFNYLLGQTLQFKRNSQIVKIIEIGSFFQIQDLIHNIINDIKLNYEQYGVILLFKIAKKFQFQWLQIMCLQKLIESKFEQFLINKFDLMNSDIETFQEILRQHQIFQSKGIVRGLKQQKIKQLIDDYSEINSTNIDEKQMLSVSFEDEQKAQKLLQDYLKSDIIPEKSKQKIKKRKNTISYFENTKFQFEQRSAKKYQIQTDRCTIRELEQINYRTLQQSNIMQNQIKRIQFQLNKPNTQINNIRHIVNKLSELQNRHIQQQKRLMKINQQVDISFTKLSSSRSSVKFSQQS